MSVPPAQVVRHESEIGRWEMVSQAAAPRLRRHVLGYCSYEEETVGFTRRRELPSGEVILIVGFGPRLKTTYPDLAPDRVATHRSFVAGLHDTHCIVESPGTQAGIQVNLTPLGAHLLLGLPMRELTNRVVELDDLLGAAEDLLVEQLHDARDWQTRFTLLDEALVRRLDCRSASVPRRRLGLAATDRRRRSSGGGRAVRGARLQPQAPAAPLQRADRRRAEDLRPRAALPARRPHARPPRRRTAGSTSASAGAGRRMSWGEIALECGYFDQAHMNRDFRQFAGASPSELAASLLPDGGGLAG